MNSIKDAVFIKSFIVRFVSSCTAITIPQKKNKKKETNRRKEEKTHKWMEAKDEKK